MSGVLEGLRALGAPRLAAMAAVAAGVLGLLLVLALRGGATHMGLLYGDLDLREAGQITERLERQHIPYQVGAGGAEMLVPTDQIGAARMLLARDGLPTGGSIGYEIFDRSDGLITSQFHAADQPDPRAGRRACPHHPRPFAACARRACMSCCRIASRSRTCRPTRRRRCCSRCPAAAGSIARRCRRS